MEYIHGNNVLIIFQLNFIISIKNKIHQDIAKKNTSENSSDNGTNSNNSNSINNDLIYKTITCKVETVVNILYLVLKKQFHSIMLAVILSFTL